MPFARIDDDYARHPKLQRIPPTLRRDAIALEVAALCYSSRVLTDGFVPIGVLTGLALEVGIERKGAVDNRRLRAVTGALCDEKRWVSCPGGWQIHDYLEYNPSADSVKERRKKEADKKRRQRGVERLPGMLSRDLSPALSPRDKSGESPGESPGPHAGAPARVPSHPIKEPPKSPNGGLVGKLSQKDLRRFTGCRMTRGSHGAGYVYDPLGVDPPPRDWPHGKPSRRDVELALEKTA